MNLDKNEHEEVIKILKGIQQVKTPKNFEADLMRRINSEKFASSETEREASVWGKIFAPSKFIPSAALAVAAILILFVIDLQPEKTVNPLMTKPKVREDVLVTSDPISIELKSKEEKETQNNTAKSRKYLSVEKTKPGQEYFSEPMFSNSNIYYIKKEGLNFRQINLDIEQRQEVKKLKQQTFDFIRNSEPQ